MRPYDLIDGRFSRLGVATVKAGSVGDEQRLGFTELTPKGARATTLPAALENPNSTGKLQQAGARDVAATSESVKITDDRLCVTTYGLTMLVPAGGEKLK